MDKQSIYVDEILKKVISMHLKIHQDLWDDSIKGRFCDSILDDKIISKENKQFINHNLLNNDINNDDVNTEIKDGLMLMEMHELSALNTHLKSFDTRIDYLSRVQMNSDEVGNMPYKQCHSPFIYSINNAYDYNSIYNALYSHYNEHKLSCLHYYGEYKLSIEDFIIFLKKYNNIYQNEYVAHMFQLINITKNQNDELLVLTNLIDFIKNNKNIIIEITSPSFISKIVYDYKNKNKKLQELRYCLILAMRPIVIYNNIYNDFAIIINKEKYKTNREIIKYFTNMLNDNTINNLQYISPNIDFIYMICKRYKEPFKDNISEQDEIDLITERRNIEKCMSFWKDYIVNGSIFNEPYEIGSITELIDALFGYFDIKINTNKIISHEIKKYIENKYHKHKLLFMKLEQN